MFHSLNKLTQLDNIREDIQLLLDYISTKQFDEIENLLEVINKI